MINRTIVVNAVEPALFSARAPLGLAIDFAIQFRNQQGETINPDTLLPVLTLRPRSAFGAWPFDIVTASGDAGMGHVQLPGNTLFDPSGYNMEIYQRRVATNPADPPVPTGMLAKGSLVLEGGTYASGTSLAQINTPVIIGPAGPQGPQGIPGVRGSLWYAGDNPPGSIPGALPGDMYLQDNGAVWRLADGAWTLGVF